MFRWGLSASMAGKSPLTLAGWSDDLQSQSLAWLGVKRKVFKGSWAPGCSLSENLTGGRITSWDVILVCFTDFQLESFAVHASWCCNKWQLGLEAFFFFFVKKRELPWFQDYWLKTGPKPQVLQSSSESVSSEGAINNRKDKTHNPNLAHILFLPMVSLVFWFLFLC